MTKNKKHCILCGNTLDPKIHHKPEETGHTSGEVAKFQKELLKNVLKEWYILSPHLSERISLESFICGIQDEMDKIHNQRVDNITTKTYGENDD